MEVRKRLGTGSGGSGKARGAEKRSPLVPWPRFSLASLLLWRSIPFLRASCGLDSSVRGRFVSLRIALGFRKKAFANGVRGVGFGGVLHL